MSKYQDGVAEKAVRKSTLRCLKEKKASRIKQLKADYEAELRKIHIEYSEDPERLKAKYASAEYAKSEKARIRAEKKIAREQKEIDLYKNFRQFTTGEEICSSIIQGVGAALFIAALAILDTLAVKNLTNYVALTVTMYSLFGSSMVLMYIFSVLSHAITNIVAKDVFKRLSHAFSYLVIGFAYTTYTLTKIQGAAGWILFGIVWLLVVLGIVFYSIFSSRISKINIILYVLAGFSGVILSKTLFHALPTTSFSLLATAAGFYVLGIIFYCLQKHRYLHFVSNIFLLAANVFMFFSMFFLNM